MKVMMAAVIVAAAAQGSGSQRTAKQKATDSQSALSKLAASLAPGAWGVLNQDKDASGWGLDFTDSGVGKGGALVYASKAAYDPARRRVYFMASGHSHEPNSLERNDRVMKFMVYEVDRNRWQRLKNPQWYLDLGLNIANTHGYQLNAVGQEYFFRAHANTPHIYACRIDAERVTDIEPRKDWKALPPVPDAGATARGFLEYFPDRKSLIFLDSSTGNLHEMSLTGSKWSLIATFPHLGQDGVAAIYNPVSKVLVFGGGGRPPIRNRKWYRLDAEGKVSPLDEAPVDSYAHNYALFTVDPVGGKHLLILPGYAFFELDLSEKPGRQWTERKDRAAGIPQFHPYVSTPAQVVSTVVVPLPEYGVNLFMGAGSVWVYKHSAKSRK